VKPPVNDDIGVADDGAERRASLGKNASFSNLCCGSPT